MKKITFCFMAMLVFLALSSSAFASLTSFKTFVGNVGYSTDGFGSTTQRGTISASVPVGATVLGAYLYTSTYFGGAMGVSLNGSPLIFTPLGLDPLNCCTLQAGRADVTGLVGAIINGGPGGIYDFSVLETAPETTGSGTDGEALVVVYSLGALPVSTVAVLDGFSASGGDVSHFSLGAPMHPGDAGFVAEMAIGDGFSCCDQASTIKVNGTTITDNAGNNDDGVGGISNGQLITVGGFDDPFSPFLPAYGDDHERYNIKGQIADGSSVITVNTLNPSNDDNIFLEVFQVTGEAKVTTGVPEPGSLSLLAAGLIAFVALGRRKFASMN